MTIITALFLLMGAHESQANDCLDMKRLETTATSNLDSRVAGWDRLKWLGSEADCQNKVFVFYMSSMMTEAELVPIISNENRWLFSKRVCDNIRYKDAMEKGWSFEENVYFVVSKNTYKNAIDCS